MISYRPLDTLLGSNRDQDERDRLLQHIVDQCRPRVLSFWNTRQSTPETPAIQIESHSAVAPIARLNLIRH